MTTVPWLPSSRRGFTLVELIVVITIMAVLTTLVAVYVVPAFSDNKNVVRGVDRVTTTLLIARQRAKRDQAPRGVRFLLAAGSTQVSQLQYIEQPDPFTGGTATAGPSLGAGLMVSLGGVDLLGGGTLGDPTGYVVQPGDYFRYEAGTPSNYQILSVDPTGLTLTLVPGNPVPVDFAGARTYRIMRQPRPIAGEDAVSLPNNVVVDLGMVQSLSPGNAIPTRTIPGTALTYYEILFDPSGAVTNSSSSAPLALVVRDATADLLPNGNPDPNTTRVVTVNPRTGFISAYPVPTSGNVLQFALAGRSGGL